MTAEPVSAGTLTPAQLGHARHELRTPVNAIIGYSEMMLEDVDAARLPQQHAAVAQILALGRRLQSLISETLDAARLDAVPPPEAAVLAGDVRGAMLEPCQEVLAACTNLLPDTACAAVAPDLAKIATATRRLLVLLDDPLQLGATSVPQPPPPAPAAPASAADEGSLPASEEEYCKGRTGHILVVDDNQFNREMLARGLHRQNRYFALAANGRQALEMLDTGAFDLVLLDIVMPEMDGFEVLRRLKADARLRHVPVIMISAVDQIDSVVRCIEMGAEDYLPKPFDPVLLRARVGACLEKKQLRDLELEYLSNVAVVTSAAAEVEAGDFRPEALDPVARRGDALGQLARVFQSMVREVQLREQRLRQEVQQLRVEIDATRTARQVAEITETDYFQALQQRAQALKGRQRPAPQ
jgi:DNA-binding response OmpR family regulator